MKQQYKHSGKTPPLGVVLGILLGLVACVPLAYLYDYGIINVPYVKMRMIFTILFGLLVGAATGWGLTLGKVRNSSIAVLMGTVVSLGALYISWGVWLLLIFQRPNADLFSLLGRPVFTWQMVLLVNANGTWSMSGSATNGIELWIIWSLEALTLVGCGLAGAVLIMKKRPFCEACDRWCGKAGQLLFTSTIAPADLMAKVNQGQFDFLKDAAPATPKQPHFTFLWHSCATCGTLNALTVSQTLPKNSKVLANQLLFPAGEIEQLKNWQAEKTALSAAAKAK